MNSLSIYLKELLFCLERTQADETRIRHKYFKWKNKNAQLWNTKSVLSKKNLVGALVTRNRKMFGIYMNNLHCLKPDWCHIISCMLKTELA